MATPATHLDEGGRLYRDLRQQVREAGLFAPDPVYYVWRTILGIGLIAVVALILALTAPGWWQVALALPLTLGSVQFAFLGHDGGHREIFRSPRANDRFVLLTSSLFLGFSLSWWQDQHNRHHGQTNHEVLDPNANISMMAFSEAQRAERHGVGGLLVRYQAWVFLPLNTLSALYKQVESVRFLMARRVRYPTVEPFLATLHFAAYGIMLFAIADPVIGAVLLAAHYGIFGLYLGALIAPNHKGMPTFRDALPTSYIARQVMSSRTVPGGRLVNFLYGGLNYQIEHHLLPTMPGSRLPAARPIVRAFCVEHDLPYEEAGVVEAYREVVRALHRFSRPSDASTGLAAGSAIPAVLTVPQGSVEDSRAGRDF